MSSPWRGPQGMDPVARQTAEQALRMAEQAKAAAVTAQGTAGDRLAGCRLGSAKTGLLLAAGGSVDLPVTWSAPLPSDGYQVEAVAGPGLIGQATLTVKSKTTGGCVITVTAVGLAVATGAVVFAHATY